MPLKAMFETALTDTWTVAADGDPVGSLRVQSNNFFKCVLSSGALDWVALDVVGYVADTGCATSSVTGAVAEGDIGAGIAQSAVTVAGTFCWIQLTGVVTLNTTLATLTVNGDALTWTGTDNLTLDLAIAADSFIVASTIDDGTDIVLAAFPIFGT